MMSIQVNGEPRHIEQGWVLGRLLEELGLAGARIAVEVNEDVVPRSRYAVTCLAAGDRIEIVHAIGGG